MSFDISCHLSLFLAFWNRELHLAANFIDSVRMSKCWYLWMLSPCSDWALYNFCSFLWLKGLRQNPFALHLERPSVAMWKSRVRSGCPKPSKVQVGSQVIQVIIVVLMLRPLLTGPHLCAQTFLSKPSRVNAVPSSLQRDVNYNQSRLFHKPSNPKWTWPLSLVILTFSVSASSFQSTPGRSSVKLQAFAGGLEGCDHHGAGRYEFVPWFIGTFLEYVWIYEVVVQCIFDDSDILRTWLVRIRLDYDDLNVDYSSHITGAGSIEFLWAFPWESPLV